jgi:isocitrate dehydrogenase (NAD+)
MSDGMFLSACREVSKEFPDIAYDEDLLDRVCLQVWHFQSTTVLF